MNHHIPLELMARTEEISRRTIRLLERREQSAGTRWDTSGSVCCA